MTSGPALAAGGEKPYSSSTSSKEEVQPGLLIVHRRITEKPCVKPVTVVLRRLGSVIVAPLVAPSIVQKPVPTAGAFPASKKFPLVHLNWSGPAAATVGA